MIERPEVSVIVATRNRAALLEGCLQSLQDGGLEGTTAEVLVVDNGSEDDTREVVRRNVERSTLPGRHVLEPRIGLNHARNRGIEESRGSIVAFLDDDARAKPGWLRALAEPLRDPAIAGAGGRIDLRFQAATPIWFDRTHAALLAAFDHGARPIPIDRFPYLVGTNMAFRRDTLERFGPFASDLDRSGGGLLSAGDTEYCHRIVRKGGRLLYAPGAVVEHVVPPERLTLRFMMRRSYAQGRSIVRFHAHAAEEVRKPPRPATLVKTLARVPGAMLRRDWPLVGRLAAKVAWQVGYFAEDRGVRR